MFIFQGWRKSSHDASMWRWSFDRDGCSLRKACATLSHVLQSHTQCAKKRVNGKSYPEACGIQIVIASHGGTATIRPRAAITTHSVKHTLEQTRPTPAARQHYWKMCICVDVSLPSLFKPLPGFRITSSCTSPLKSSVDVSLLVSVGAARGPSFFPSVKAIPQYTQKSKAKGSA
jgi:hypothetical protein